MLRKRFSAAEAVSKKSRKEFPIATNVNLHKRIKPTFVNFSALQKHGSIAKTSVKRGTISYHWGY